MCSSSERQEIFDGNSGFFLSFIDFAHSWRVAATASSTDATLLIVSHYTFEVKKAVKCCKLILSALGDRKAFQSLFYFVFVKRNLTVATFF
jgi:hypothetical protein